MASTPPSFSVSITLRNSCAFTPASMRRNTCFVWRDTSAWRARSPSTSIGTDLFFAQRADRNPLVLTIRQRQRDVHRFCADRLTSPCDRQLNLQPTLHHRCRHHEDDQQHEHDVDERHDVDLGERRRRAAAAPRMPAFFVVEGLNFRHYVKLRSTMFRNSSEKSSISDASPFTRCVSRL